MSGGLQRAHFDRLSKLTKALRTDPTAYLRFGGKRLTQVDRTLISVPLGNRNRALFREVQGRIRLIKAMTHEEYNSFIWRK
ncbi:MAG: hypothetical protein QJR02_01405 [Sinobacteraceae bacterium]|nr:hypothetical protein [Nevskiaceae bacterium]